MSRGAIDLHGHSHGRMAPLPRQFDVDVDVWSFRPVGLGALLASRHRARVGRVIDIFETAEEDEDEPSSSPPCR